MQHEYKPTTIYADIHYLGLRCVFVLPPHQQSTVSSERLNKMENNI